MIFLKNIIIKIFSELYIFKGLQKTKIWIWISRNFCMRPLCLKCFVYSDESARPQKSLGERAGNSNFHFFGKSFKNSCKLFEGGTYTYGFCQIVQGLRLFRVLRLLRTSEEAKQEFKGTYNFHCSKERVKCQI